MRVVYIVILCSIQMVWCISHSLTDSCRPRYELSNSAPGNIIVKVKKNASFCKRQLYRPGVESLTEDLKPLIDVPYFKNGDYFFNITWKVRLNENKKFPRFALSLKYTIPEQNITNEECIVLRLKNKTAIEDTGGIKMYFDCIKLQDSIDEGDLSLQLWQINCGGSRGKRSSSSCGQITKSRQTHRSLALDDYKRQICSCHYSCGISKPASNITVLYDGGSVVNFKISVTNLPRFTRIITIKVYSSNGESWEYSTNKELAVINGSLIFVTNLDAYTDGAVYTITMDYQCVDGRNSHLPSTCFPSDKYLLENSTAVMYVDTRHQHYQHEFNVVIFVTCGTIAFALTAIAVIIFMRRARSSYHRADHSQLNTFDSTTEDFTSLIEHDTDISSIQLHHPDMDPVYHQITDKLTDSRIVLEDGREGNWREFASKCFASKQSRIDITIFVTEGLFELLYGDNESKNKRLIERQYENVPDMVLCRLHTLTHAERERVRLHFVSLNNFKGRQLSQLFIDSGQFDNIYIVFHTYYFQPESLESEQNQSEVNRLTENICNR